jgi:hypothetical protein
VLWAQGTARASAALGDEQNGGPFTAVVYPTGQHPADVNNVQAAVSAGGRVLLKATDTAGVFTPFNVGPAVAGSGTVFLNADVQLTGKTVAGRMTTITGGDTPFRSLKLVESVLIRNNVLSVEGPEAEGIHAFGDEVYNKKVQNLSVEKNEITVTDGLAGIGLWGEVVGAEVRNNRIRGGAQYAMLLGAGFFDPTEQSVGNKFTGNNISTFDASVADVFFDTNTLDNVLKGHGGTVIDLGIGNIITGSRKSLPVHAEEQLRSAQRSMRGLIY